MGCVGWLWCVGVTVYFGVGFPLVDLLFSFFVLWGELFLCIFVL